MRGVGVRGKTRPWGFHESVSLIPERFILPRTDGSGVEKAKIRNRYG